MPLFCRTCGEAHAVQPFACCATSTFLPFDWRLPILTIRQPWAWLILHGGKNIENRVWQTPKRGPFLIHAAKGMTKAEYHDAMAFAVRAGFPEKDFPAFDALPRGCIVGQATLTDCVTRSDSPWFVGPYGFLITEPSPLPAHTCKGELGFFRIRNASVPVTPLAAPIATKSSNEQPLLL